MSTLHRLQMSTKVDQMTIRRIRVTDRAALKSIRLKALQDAPEAFAQQYAEVKDKPGEYWDKWAEKGAVGNEACLYLAFNGTAVVGMAGAHLEPVNPKLAHLIAVWLEPEYRGTGLAERLIRSVIAWAREAGAERITAWVTEINQRARRFYRRLGFIEQPERQTLPSGQLEILTVKSLAQDAAR